MNNRHRHHHPLQTIEKGNYRSKTELRRKMKISAHTQQH